MTYEETAALSRMTEALSILHTQYASVSNAETRREQLKQFMAEALKGVAELGEELEADPLMIVHSLDYIKECIDDGFVDAIDAEDAREPRIDVRQYSTLHTYRGSVVG